MKVRFLGTGAAPAMPVPFCECDACATAREAGGKNLRRRSSLLVDDELLIDPGPDVVSSSFDQHAYLNHVRVILQTHPHHDHFDPEFLTSRHSEWGTRPAGSLMLVGSRETLERLDTLFQERCAYGSMFDRATQKALQLELKEVEPFERYIFGRYRVIPYPANHATAPKPLIYSVSDDRHSVFYGTDTSVITESVWRDIRAREVRYDLVVLDHTYGIGFESTDHLAAHDVAHTAEMLRADGLLKSMGEVYATHLSHEGIREHDELERYAVRRGYHIAHDGLTLSL